MNLALKGPLQGLKRHHLGSFQLLSEESMTSLTPEVLNWELHGVLFALNSSKLFNVWKRTEHSVSKWKTTHNECCYASCYLNSKSFHTFFFLSRCVLAICCLIMFATKTLSTKSVRSYQLSRISVFLPRTAKHLCLLLFLSVSQ